jgi:hypothetical protein
MATRVATPPARVDAGRQPARASFAPEPSPAWRNASTFGYVVVQPHHIGEREARLSQHALEVVQRLRDLGAHVPFVHRPPIGVD